MPSHPSEVSAMKRALELAGQGWGRVAPNPMVGAVLLREGRVVGEGHHAEFGSAHAEVEALSSCDDPAGTTCVLNLEPCAHEGKTPPCADALIEAGVERVVFAVSDPDPDAKGGAARLRTAGIEVERGLAQHQAAALNAPFLCAHRDTERPFVAVKLATSIDGYIADHRGRSQWISGDEARDWVHWLRAGFDAIGVGRVTANRDDPQLTVRGPLQPRVPPIRVVFSQTGALRDDLRLLHNADSAPTILITRPDCVAAMQSVASHSVSVQPAATLEDALCRLRGLGVRSLLIEGGAGLTNAFLGGGLVDRIYWVQAPIFLGGGTRAFAGSPTATLDEAVCWVPTDRTPLGRDTLLVVDRGLCLQES